MPSIYLDFVSLEAYGVDKAVLLDRLQGAILAALPEDLKLQLRSLLEAHGFVPEEEIVVVQQPSKTAASFIKTSNGQPRPPAGPEPSAVGGGRAASGR